MTSPPAPEPHPARVWAALVPEPRLRIFSAALIAGPAPVASLAVTAGLDERNARRQLDALAAAGLASCDDDGRWVADAGPLRSASRRASRLVLPPDDGVDEGLSAFFSGGRLTHLPAQRAKRLAVLDHLAQGFEPGVRYPEAEVNRIVGRFHDDHASLRRALVDEDFLERRDRAYWRSGGTVDVDG